MMKFLFAFGLGVVGFMGTQNSCLNLTHEPKASVSSRAPASTAEPFQMGWTNYRLYGKHRVKTLLADAAIH